MSDMDTRKALERLRQIRELADELDGEHIRIRYTPSDRWKVGARRFLAHMNKMDDARR